MGVGARGPADGMGYREGGRGLLGSVCKVCKCAATRARTNLGRPASATCLGALHRRTKHAVRLPTNVTLKVTASPPMTRKHTLNRFAFRSSGCVRKCPAVATSGSFVAAAMMVPGRCAAAMRERQGRVGQEGGAVL